MSDGHCTEGARCVCGGDLPSVRAGCHYWRASAPQQAQEKSLPPQGATSDDWRMAAFNVVSLGEKFAQARVEADIPTGHLYKGIAADNLARSRKAFTEAVYDLAAKAQAAPASLPPQGAASGWKLVPVEPTLDMIESGAQRLVSWGGEDCKWPDDWSLLQVSAARNEAERVWRSMWLAASPAPAPQEPAAWIVTRLRRRDDEQSGRVRYPHLSEQAAREDFDGWAEVPGAKPTIDALYASPAPGELGAVDAAAGWISVDDRMPEPDSGEVLVWLSGGRCAFDEWHMHREDPTGMSTTYTMEMGLMWRDYEFEDITHWMPLPQPPQQAPSESSAQGSGGEKA